MTACIVGWSHGKFGKLDGETSESLVVKAASEAIAHGIERQHAAFAVEAHSVAIEEGMALAGRDHAPSRRAGLWRP